MNHGGTEDTEGNWRVALWPLRLPPQRARLGGDASPCLSEVRKKSRSGEGAAGALTVIEKTQKRRVTESS